MLKDLNSTQNEGSYIVRVLFLSVFIATVVLAIVVASNANAVIGKKNDGLSTTKLAIPKSLNPQANKTKTLSARQLAVLEHLQRLKRNRMNGFTFNSPLVSSSRYRVKVKALSQEESTKKLNKVKDLQSTFNVAFSESGSFFGETEHTYSLDPK